MLFLQAKRAGKPFTPDAKRALASTNTMDRWILAAAHGLVAFMRTEMGAYRLYTVVPKLLGFIDSLTNWCAPPSPSPLLPSLLVTQ